MAPVHRPRAGEAEGGGGALPAAGFTRARVELEPLPKLLNHTNGRHLARSQEQPDVPSSFAFM